MIAPKGRVAGPVRALLSRGTGVAGHISTALTIMNARAVKLAFAFVLAVAVAIIVAACLERTAPPPPPVAAVPTPAAKTQRFEATAYTIEGTTASGKQTRHGIVAADPRILP